MNNCFIYPNNHNHEDLRNLLTNFDNNMKMNDEKLKSLIEFVSSTGRYVGTHSDECTRLNSPKMIKKSVMTADVADSLMNQINNSQHEVFSLIQQFNDFQSTFGNSTKGNVNESYNDLKYNNSDDLGLSEIDTVNGTNSRNIDDLDVFSVDPNALTFPFSMKKLELKKKNVFGNKLNFNNIYHFKQNWQLKLLSRKLKNMKKDISELKVSINEISVFKDKVKNSINILENRVQKLSKSGSPWNSVMDSGSHIHNIQYDNESSDDSWGIVRTKFENLIVKNECHLNFMNCLLNQLLFVSTDDQRTQVLTQIQEIVSKTITTEIIESSLENSYEDYFHNIEESHKNIKNMTVDNILNDTIVNIQSNDEHFMDSELNDLCETSVRLLNIQSDNECIRDDFDLCHILERSEKTTNEELKLSTKIDMLIQSIEDIMKPFVNKTFDNNLKEEIYEKILKESENFFKEELSNIKTIDSKSPLKEISNLSFNNFFKDHLSLRVWNCLSAFDNQLTTNCLSVLLTNLSEFLVKHLKSVLFIVEKLENNSKNEKAKCFTQSLKHEFLSNKNEVDIIDINAVSSYMSDPEFTLNNETSDINTTNENIKSNSLNQLDAEEKDWVCQAEKKETIGNSTFS